MKWKFSNKLGQFVFHMKELYTHRNTKSILSDLERSQWFAREKLINIQTDKLQKIVHHCYYNVPYYKNLFRHHSLKPSDIKTLEDLKKFPVLTKVQLRDESKQFQSTLPEHSVKHTVVRTSGSTGERLIFKHGQSTMQYHLANQLRGRAWWDIETGDSELKFWGISTQFENNLKEKAISLLKRFKDKMLSVTHVSPFDMSDRQLHNLVLLMLKKRPLLIFGYGTAIYLFARFVETHNYDLKGYHPHVIIYTSETIYQTQKELIERVLGAPLVCEYGSVECGIMAYECPEHNLHLMDETLYFEQINNNEILVTHLESFAFPLLRYKIGDLGKISKTPCPCGRGLTVLESFIGRSNDVIQRPNGEPVHPELFDYIMRYQTNIKRFRIVERSLGHLEVLLEITHDFSNNQLHDINKTFQEHLGNDFHITFTPTKMIPNSLSGKFQWVIGKNKGV